MDTCIASVCLIAATITNMDMMYNNPMPSTAYSYDGVARDISHFYDDKQTNFSIDTAFYFSSNTRIDLGFNNGFKTNKMHQHNTYRVGATQYFELTDNSGLSTSVHTQIGGKVKHTPCFDNYNRQYYCGNLTAWSDFEDNDEKTPYNLGIKYSYRF